MANLLALSPMDVAPLDFDTGTIMFIGTATVLVRYAGFTILTDPNFLHQGQKVHLGYGLHSTRLTNPALEMSELPPLDLVVLSHLHEDHFDREVAARLDHSVPIVTTPQAAKGLQAKGFTATQPLAMWQTLTVTKGEAKLNITALPGRHGPGFADNLLPQVMGSLWDFQTRQGELKYRLYVTGDTLLFDYLKQIPARYPDIDLALLHLGGTQILGITLTMTGRQGVDALRIIMPRQAIPIHYSDYTVFKSPLSDFEKAAQEAGLQTEIIYLQPGETFSFEPKKAQHS